MNPQFAALVAGLLFFFILEQWRADFGARKDSHD